MPVTKLARAARLADVAKAAGVSQGTVSNVFNRPEVVREEVREHVRAVASRIGYRGPDPKGRLLRAGKVNAIGVATFEPLSYFFEDPFARTLMQGISDACDDAGAGLSLVSAQNRERITWNVESALVDGFVLLCIEEGDRLVALTRNRQLPFVALALGKPDPTVSAVGSDDYAGAKLAAEHICGLGHRNVAVLALEFIEGRTGWIGPRERENVSFFTAPDRLRGYFEVLEAHGVDTDKVPVWETLNDMATVTEGLEAIFAKGERPTALLCMSDRVALSAIEWLEGRGLRVPQDISVIGYDGIPEGSASRPKLTTVSQPIEEIGRRAVEIILEGGDEIRRETLPVELVIRESTAALKG